MANLDPTRLLRKVGMANLDPTRLFQKSGWPSPTYLAHTWFRVVAYNRPQPKAEPPSTTKTRAWIREQSREVSKLQSTLTCSKKATNQRLRSYLMTTITSPTTTTTTTRVSVLRRSNYSFKKILNKFSNSLMHPRHLQTFEPEPN